ncbi:MAG: Wzz/FepE/Etk N-terminal domain-containing protein [Mucilaginibacter sp.]
MENNELNSVDEISLKELILKLGAWWRFLLSKWVTIVIVGIIGGAIGLTYTFLKKPIYKADLSFALEDEKSAGGLSSALGLASQFGFDLGNSGGGAFSGDNLLELMKSRSMVEKTLLTSINNNGKEQTLAELYIFFNKYRKSWESNPSLKSIQYLPRANRSLFSLQQDSILGVFYSNIIKSNLTVDKTDKKLSIINVEVKSKNEQFSKLFVENLVKTVSDFYVNTKTRKTAQNVIILQHQTDSVRRELNAAINGVALSIDANPNANPALQILRAPSQSKQVNVTANTAILGELVKNLEAEKVVLRKETPLIQIIDSPILPLEVEKMGSIKGFIIGYLIASIMSVTFILFRKISKNILS